MRIIIGALACSALLAAAPAHAESQRLTVRLHVCFDRSIEHNLRSRVEAEASKIWIEYGVHLLFADSDEPADLDLDVAVTMAGQHHEDDLHRSVLGTTKVAPDETAPDNIRIAFDEVGALLKPLVDYGLMREIRTADAVGRVLAHEVGHVLLGAHHDSSGLMRAVFIPRELAWPERAPFRLADAGVERLRTRIERYGVITMNQAATIGP